MVDMVDMVDTVDMVGMVDMVDMVDMVGMLDMVDMVDMVHMVDMERLTSRVVSTHGVTACSLPAALKPRPGQGSAPVEGPQALHMVAR